MDCVLFGSLGALVNSRKPDPNYWYDKCIIHVMAVTKCDINKATEAVNDVCQILHDHGFIDADWYTENESVFWK